MQKIKTFSVALVAMLAFGALSVSAADAFEWQVEGASLTNPVAVSATSTITFANTDEGYEFKCTIARKGMAGVGAKGEITSITSSGGAKAIPCELIHSSGDCSSAMEIEAVGLPWATEIVAVEGQPRNKLAATQVWKVRCKGIGGEARSNVCDVPATAGLHNNSKGVEQADDSLSAHTACSLDSGDPFVTTGSELLSSGVNILSVGPTALWRIAGGALGEAVATSWSGKMKLSDPKAPESLECEVKAGGKAGLLGSGEVTEWTSSGCVGKFAESGVCEKNKYTTLEAVNLPWHTELFTEAGVVHDVLENGGKGAPAYKMTCVVLGIHEEDQCTGGLNLALTNVAGGVSAAFNATEKLNCTRGGSGSGTVEGTQTISTSGGKLEAS
jgi:hypothetical protein